MSVKDFKMLFDIGTIKHLGIHMYSTLPPVIGELVSNAWDADTEVVEITIPDGPLNDDSEIVVYDNGCGMSDEEVRLAYLIVGRDRRKDDDDAPTAKYGRAVMGRKGIGKFSAFGIASEIEIETVKEGKTSRFIMNYEELEKYAEKREYLMPPLEASGKVKTGTKITLRNINKYRSRSISVPNLRRGLARRFSIIAEEKNFAVSINGKKITLEERDLQRSLDLDTDGNKYLWEINDEEIKPETGWTVKGWIGALKRTDSAGDDIQRGIVIMARGKLVQEPFVFDATVGQQYALSYLVGELHAEFVDASEDTIGTTRNCLVWDTDRNSAFKEWGEKKVNKIAREWAEKRKKDNEKKLKENSFYLTFSDKAKEFENRRSVKIADKLIREVAVNNPLAEDKEMASVVTMCLNFLEFDAFRELSEDLMESDLEEVARIVDLFKEWEIVEAKEMMRVTEGRINTIEKLQNLIDGNALEVPTLHNFLKEFPWVLDPRWTLVEDEVRYSDLLREKFPESNEIPEKDRRIDFLCVAESNSVIVVEIKRPKFKASKKELLQLEEYVLFMRDHITQSTDPSVRKDEVIGYLLCGELVDTSFVREKRKTFTKDNIFIRLYSDLLKMVKDNHKEFLNRYIKLSEAKKKALQP